MEKVVGIIPARGGSKTVPRKNIRLLGGRPLIAYSIEHGLASRYIGRVLVSTEDSEIAQIARDNGAAKSGFIDGKKIGDFPRGRSLFH